MKLRNRVITTAAFCLVSSVGLGATVQAKPTEKNVASAETTQSLAAQVKKLKEEFKVWQSEEAQTQRYTSWDKRNQFTSRLGGMPVTTSPYLGVQSRFDAGDLLVMVPSVNEDLRLLYFNKNIESTLLQAHQELPSSPYIKISGKAEGITQAVRNHKPKGSSNDIDLDEAEIDLLMAINPYVTGYLALSYDSSVTNPARTPVRTQSSRIFLKKGFMTVGNLNRSPFYGSVGQMFVPFGRYASAMISSPLTLALGRTHARALLLGYDSSGGTVGPYASVFAFKGDTAVHNTRQNKVQTVGVNADYLIDTHGVNADVGVSLINNLADSEGMQRNYVFGNSVVAGQSVHGEAIDHRVGAFDIHVRANMQDVFVLAEYVAAAKAFSVNDLTYNNHGAKPTALNTELGYNFSLGDYPSSVAVGYGQTNEALDLGLAKQRYVAVFNTSLFKSTIQSVEFYHDRNYKASDTSRLRALDTSPYSRAQNAVTAKFGVYF